MGKILLAEATRNKADSGDYRVIYVGSMGFTEGGERVEQTQQIFDCMHAAGLHADPGDVVFEPASSDSRNNYCAVKIAAAVGDDASDPAKRAAEAFPHATTLTFRLDGLGGFDFAGVKQANVTRLPWGGSGSEMIASVRGPLLINRIYNEEHLTHFQQRVLTPTVLRIVATMIDAERAHLKTRSDLTADETQAAGARNASTVKAARVRARLGTLQALQAQPEQAFWPGLHSLHIYDASDVLDATAKFSERPARGVKDRERTRLARAFCMDSGIICVHELVQGIAPTMERLINKVASRLMTVKPNGDVEPLRGTFCPEELHFSEPTRAVAKTITECVVKTKIQLAVFSKHPGDESTETQHPWAWVGMSLATMRSPVPEDEHTLHEIEDHGVREAFGFLGY